MYRFFIASTHLNCGLSTVTLGLVRAFEKLGQKVRYFKPISQYKKPPLSGSVLPPTNSWLKPYQSICLKEVEDMLGTGQRNLLMEAIVANYNALDAKEDIVIIEGLAPTEDAPYLNRINGEIARTLNAHVVLVSAPTDQKLSGIGDRIEIASENYGGIKNTSMAGYIINKLPNNIYTAKIQGKKTSELNALSKKPLTCLGYVPWKKGLWAPKMQDVCEFLQSCVIHKGALEQKRMVQFALCACDVEAVEQYLKPDHLIITSIDRNDIILACAIAVTNGVPLAGLLLTDGKKIHPATESLCRKVFETAQLPVIATDKGILWVLSKLKQMKNQLSLDDYEYLEQIMDEVAQYLYLEKLKNYIGAKMPTRLSPPAFRHRIVSLASQKKRRIVLPEGTEPRIISAAITCHERHIAQCLLLGNPKEVTEIAANLGKELPSDLQILDPKPLRASYVEALIALRKHKGMIAASAKEQLRDNVVLGTMMLACDEVDGLVAGATHTTANTIRPAFQLIKPKPGVRLVSAVFFMLLPEQVFVYADCVINPNPNAEELADIAIQSADSAHTFGIEPRVAMISYSTGASGQGVQVDKIRRATAIAQSKRPDLLIDGPLQFDAATVKSVAQQKAPQSPIAGNATVLVFPDLNTGNTTYKAVQRSASVLSIGPMLQGLNKPVNDLSRGALIEDIVYTIALTAAQCATP